jgi:hypothetical protein
MDNKIRMLGKNRIEDILKKRNSPLISYVKNTDYIGLLPYEIRKLIAEELGDEICERGINNTGSELNNYGIELDDLIDICIYDDNNKKKKQFDDNGGV